MQAEAFFKELLRKRAGGKAAGICSVCSASPHVLQAAMEQAMEDGKPVLIESTANQVDQFGGYTGMKPEDFAGFVYALADRVGLPRQRVILGGDHLGPLVWRQMPEAEAMPLAQALVEAYVLAGFTKIHLDTSMRLGDDDTSVPLSDEVIARRGAQLCRASEQAFAKRKAAMPDAAPPVYVIGSEVPTPGGMGAEEEANTLAPTPPQAFLGAYRTFAQAFAQGGLEDAFGRVVAFVVQPGVEFSGEAVFDYDRQRAKALCDTLGELGAPLVFEGHSTDYQRPEGLRAMVEDGIAILKVGPGLTFALREGLMALEGIEREMVQGTALAPSRFAQILEEAMLKDPKNWQGHYTGNAESQRLQRRYSYYDRARYYLPKPQVAAAIERLLDNLQATGVPLTLLSQYMPYAYEACRAGALRAEPAELLKESVRRCLRAYAAATAPAAG